MATHSSTLAWKIPWSEKPGRQTVGKESDMTEQLYFQGTNIPHVVWLSQKKKSPSASKMERIPFLL